MINMFKKFFSWFFSLFVKSEPKPCESYFQKLADESPEKLELYIRKTYLNPSQLTFAIEILGDTCSYQIADRTIIPMLWHESPIVREGAVYGLRRFITNPTVSECLNSILKADPSPGVRQVIKDMLSDL